MLEAALLENPDNLYNFMTSSFQVPVQNQFMHEFPFSPMKARKDVCMETGESATISGITHAGPVPLC